VPANVVAALQKSLEKLPADRFESARAFGHSLADAGFDAGTQATGGARHHAPDVRTWLRDARSRIALVAVAALLVVAVGTNGFRAPPAAADAPPIAARLGFAAGDRVVGAPGDRANADRPSRTAIAISPDGRSLVFVGEREGVRQLFVRALSGEAAIPIPGTQGAESPFYSPDGKSIGFWSDGRLMRAAFDGGQPSQIALTPRITGGSWSDDDRIAVGLEAQSGGLVIFSLTGNAPPDTIRGSRYHLPQFLPGGGAILFSERSGTQGTTLYHTRVITLGDRAIKPLVENAADARFVPTGHLVFARRGTLVAVPFDLQRLEVSGNTVVLLDDVMQSIHGFQPTVMTGAMQVAISPTGTLVYLTGGVVPDRVRHLSWLDRAGRETVITTAGTRAYFAVRISPDERSIVATTMGQRASVHILDLARNTMLTLPDTTFQLWPLWSLDGKRVVHRGIRGDSVGLMWSLADGSRPATGIADGGLIGGDPEFWSPDGRTLYLRQNGLTAVHVATGEKTQVPNLPAGLMHPTLSPDAQWLAYSAPEAGGEMLEVFVQPWPALDRKWKISTDGGQSPAWTRNGAEIVYVRDMPEDSTVETPRRMMSVQLSPGPDPDPQPPRLLFTAHFATSTPTRAFDVAKDGSRFLMVIGGHPHAPPGEPHIIVNWFTELRRLSGSRGTAP
jgi:eukaryotic-like serine/threonine-protein kinase